MIEQTTALTGEETLPKIDLSAEPPTAGPGERVRLEWRVEGAASASLWASSGPPWAPHLLNWARIMELGERVPLSGGDERAFETTTAVYLVARGENGWAGTYTRVDVGEATETRVEPQAWSPLPEFYRLMQRGPAGIWEIPQFIALPNLKLLERLIPVGWQAGGPSSVTASVTPEAIFTDEQSTFSYSVNGATGASNGFSLRATYLLTDASSIYGTKYDGAKIGAGGSPFCGAPMTGTWQIAGQSQGHCRQHFSAQACTLPGAPSAAADCWLDILGVPQFKGNATPTRKTEIRSALKTFDVALRKGAIINDGSLDGSVDAFKTGRISRSALWFRLMDELENLNLITINCQDVADKAWIGGQWTDYKNEILLQWSPSNPPWVEYILAHELIHKCGFNGLLKKWYTEIQIEYMAHTISKSVFHP